jgi:hypothetical protein
MTVALPEPRTDGVRPLPRSDNPRRRSRDGRGDDGWHCARPERVSSDAEREALELVRDTFIVDAGDVGLL